MVAAGPDDAGGVPPPVPVGAPEAQRQARYNHLVGRLRSRQITMEEATELFTLMQAMLRASEAARRAVLAAPARATTPPEVPRPGPALPAPASPMDDMFLVGLLAMGAGAGLLAAMARRLADAAPPRDDPDRATTERRGR